MVFKRSALDSTDVVLEVEGPWVTNDIVVGTGADGDAMTDAVPPPSDSKVSPTVIISSSIHSITFCFHFWSILAPYLRSVLMINTKYIIPRKKTDVIAMRTPTAPRGERASKVPVLGGDVEEPVRQTKERMQTANRIRDLMDVDILGKYRMKFRTSSYHDNQIAGIARSTQTFHHIDLLIFFAS